MPAAIHSEFASKSVTSYRLRTSLLQSVDVFRLQRTADEEGPLVDAELATTSLLLCVTIWLALNQLIA